MTQFLASLRHQFRIILALLGREEERRRQAPMESILAVLEPLLILATLSLLWYLMGHNSRPPVGTSAALYYGTGLLPLYLFISISGRSVSYWTSWNRRFPIEQRLDYSLVATLLRVVDYVIAGTLLFGGLYEYGVSDANPRDYIPIFEALTAIAMLGFGWGVLQITISTVLPVWRYISMGISRGLLLFSGVFFVADTMPPTTRYIMSFNPMLHAVELFKNGFYPNYGTLTLDRSYLIGCAIAFVLMGLVLERITRRSEAKPRLVRRG